MSAGLFPGPLGNSQGSPRSLNLIGKGTERRKGKRGSRGGTADQEEEMKKNGRNEDGRGGRREGIKGRKEGEGITNLELITPLI